MDFIEEVKGFVALTFCEILSLATKAYETYDTKALFARLLI